MVDGEHSLVIRDKGGLVKSIALLPLPTMQWTAFAKFAFPDFAHLYRLLRLSNLFHYDSLPIPPVSSLWTISWTFPNPFPSFVA